MGMTDIYLAAALFPALFLISVAAIYAGANVVMLAGLLIESLRHIRRC